MLVKLRSITVLVIGLLSMHLCRAITIANEQTTRQVASVDNSSICFSIANIRDERLTSKQHRESGGSGGNIECSVATDEPMYLFQVSRSRIVICILLTNAEFYSSPPVRNRISRTKRRKCASSANLNLNWIVKRTNCLNVSIFTRVGF